MNSIGKQRYYSLDVFRGATVCLMILVNNPGSWTYAFSPLKHAKWHGLTPTDLVFPFFLFAVGNAMAFVIPRLQQNQNDALFWKKVIRRTLLIFLIGLFLSWWPFFKWDDNVLVFRNWVDPNKPESGVRILGVLQRIAICYFFASVIVYYFKSAKAFYISILILLFYWVLCLLGNPADPYSLTGWFGTDIDKKILHIPHMYKGEGIPFDPEGLMSTLPAIAQVIFGFLVGEYIQYKTKSTGDIFKTITGLFIAAMALLMTGYIWDLVFPVNKKIWTSSYVVATTGLAMLILAAMIYIFEVQKYKGWIGRFFDVFGKNALFVFALSAFLPKTLSLVRLGEGLTPWNWMYKKVFVHIPGAPEIGSLAYALFIITFMWFICWWLDKRKIYIKV